MLDAACDASARQGLGWVLPGLAALIRKYADRPMDLADASLVWLADNTGVTDIIMIDRADSAVYRTSKRKSFKNPFAG